ncbi:MAG: TonB-dependent receptor [Flavobacteriaceae bacterium]|nr:TonB-dependent receptor [Flavobacteriaceae bacterium]
MKTKIILFISFLMLSFTMMAQYQVSGTVTENNGQPLPGVSITVKGTVNGTSTDFDGKYSLKVSTNDVLEFTTVGFESISKIMNGDKVVNVSMSSGLLLDEIVLVGSRNPKRTATDTAVPVDVIDISEISSLGAQVSVNEILNYVAPSFTSQSQTVSDGTDHIDPASLRGLGPDQVLVLINGKRRHNTSLLNINGTVGAGSVGTDMNAIPAAAIKRIEVLRDGAAAQYGSDAIAGVINIILNDDVNKLALTLTTGANASDGANHQDGGVDGEKIQLDANYGLALGDNGGFINFTGSVATRNPALRNATNLEQIYDIANAVEHAFTSSTGSPISDMTAADYQTGALLLGTNYISATNQTAIGALDLSTDANGNLNTPGDLALLSGLLPDGGTGEFATYQELDDAQFAERGLERNDFRFKVGTSKLREGKFFANLSLPVSENTELYAFGGISYRQGLGFGFLREPWRPKANTAVNANGFLPGIQSDILDQSFAIGLKGETDSGWNVDFSNTYGRNAFAFTVIGSTNASLGAASPSDFDAGSFSFAQNTTNLDFSKFNEDIFSGLNLAFGAEFRAENFQIFEGAENSYATYDDNGIPTIGGVGGATNALGETLDGAAQVFGGFTPQNATNKSRNSIAFYGDVEADLSEAFLISLATRFESFSDFGSTFNYKIASRYKITDNLNLRGAYSTGFRAPSLHQQFFSRSSTIFDANGVSQEEGLFTNDSQAAKLLGIEKLKEETSQSMSIGTTFRSGGFSLTVDAYQITIDDRIVLSGAFDDGGDPTLISIFNAAGAGKARFLANAIDTKNQGIDVVLGYKFDVSSSFKLDNSLAATFSRVEITNVNIPEKIAAAGLSGDFFDGQEEAFLTIAQPREKINLTHILSNDKWTFLVRNVYFGEVTDPDDFVGDITVDAATISNDAIYAGKIITDLTISNRVSDNTTISIGANNLLDVYPDENRVGGQSNASFPYSRRTSQFGFMGRYVFAKLSFNL